MCALTRAKLQGDEIVLLSRRITQEWMRGKEQLRILLQSSFRVRGGEENVEIGIGKGFYPEIWGGGIENLEFPVNRHTEKKESDGRQDHMCDKMITKTIVTAVLDKAAERNRCHASFEDHSKFQP